jgi:hypothetical protein
LAPRLTLDPADDIVRHRRWPTKPHAVRALDRERLARALADQPALELRKRR